MRTPTARRRQSRAGLRDGSDRTAAEWAMLGRVLPSEAKGGRQRACPMREGVNAICYVLRGGRAWRLRPDTVLPLRWRSHRLLGRRIEAAMAHGLSCSSPSEAGYQAPRGAAASPIRVEIVRKPERQVGFTVHARRWVGERFFACINPTRRLAKDVEPTIAAAETSLYAASAILLLRRLARR